LVCDVDAAGAAGQHTALVAVPFEGLRVVGRRQRGRPRLVHD
jgi:hypothetical protein